ncbi:MAG TPA: ABC transporter substrate-binding protein [Burkholderiales bacterium]|jgi:putative ABC transport system substrate-binding protein|nr:ABC transporter substrate-binding protein [Burkholderiales bacterium]
MNRRDALAALASMLIWPVRGAAQQQGRVPVVGLLITHPPADDVVVDFFRAAMRKYQYEDGKNVKLEVRTALGRLDRVSALAEELVRLPVDVLVVVNEVALQASRQITRATPIVMIGFIDDPVALGVIESYRRPGGNITGVFNVNAALSAKRLEILKETLPNLSRAAVLWDAFSKRQLDELQGAARALSIRLDLIEVKDADDLDRAFKSAQARKAGAVIMNFSPVFWINRTRIATIALKAGLPTISDMQLLAHSGCLLAYGSDGAYNWERGAYFVDRLLKGADAAELPVERLSKLTLVVNLKTAKSLSITIPQSVLLRADEVIR